MTERREYAIESAEYWRDAAREWAELYRRNRRAGCQPAAAECKAAWRESWQFHRRYRAEAEALATR